jgi:hypothetical protein
MTFVKTFEDFKNQVSQVSEKAISGGSVTKEAENKAAGELAKFTVVLKATSDNDTISDANPAQSALDHLVNNQEFQNWYSGETTSNDAAANAFTSSNSASIAFIDTGKHRQAGFLKREKATETFIFKRIGSPNTTDRNKSELNYDVKKFPAQAKSKVASGGTVYAWNLEQEKTMALKPAQPMTVPLGSLTVDLAMKTAIAATPAIQSTPQTPPATQIPAGSGGVPADTQAPTNTSQASSYAGLKRTQTFDKRIQDLQKTIIAKGGLAADAIVAKGGAIGKYGSGTAKAIGILIGTNKEENEITADIDAKLKTALAGVTVSGYELAVKTAASKARVTSQAAAKAAPAAKTGGSSQAAAKPSDAAKTITTKKGPLTF